MADSEPTLKLVCCGACQAPVVKGAGRCRSCGARETGKEIPYMAQSGGRPELMPLFKWWAIWSAIVWAISGFSLGKVTSLLLTGVALVYAIRILRTYYAD